MRSSLAAGCMVEDSHISRCHPQTDRLRHAWLTSVGGVVYGLPSSFLFGSPVSESFVGTQIIKVRKDGDYHWKTGEIMPVGVPCLLERAIANKQAQLDKLEAMIENERNKERVGIKKEKEYVSIANANANVNFPYRMPDKQEAANAGQANAEMVQDQAIARSIPLLEKRKIIVDELDKLEMALNEFRDIKKPSKKDTPRFRPLMVSCEEESPTPGPGGGGISVLLPDASLPAPPGMEAVQVLSVGSKAPNVTEGGAYEPLSGVPEANGSTLVNAMGPVLDFGSREQDTDLDQPQEAPSERLMPLPPMPVLAPLLTLLPEGPAALGDSSKSHGATSEADAWRARNIFHNVWNSRPARRRSAAVRSFF